MKDIEKVISTLNAKGLFGEIKVIENLLEKLEAAEHRVSVTERKLAKDMCSSDYEASKGKE